MAKQYVQERRLRRTLRSPFLIVVKEDIDILIVVKEGIDNIYRIAFQISNCISDFDGKVIPIELEEFPMAADHHSHHCGYLAKLYLVQ